LRAAVTLSQPVLQRVIQSFSKAATEAPMTAQPSTPPRPAMAEFNQAKLLELRDFLKASDMRALTAYEQLSHAMEESKAADLHSLHAAMAVFDFAQAAQVCDDLLADYQK
jgi:hypothetical protein